MLVLCQQKGWDGGRWVGRGRWVGWGEVGGTGGDGWDGGDGWGHLQGAVHMVAARLGFQKAMVGSRRATPCSDCMDRLRKHYSHLAEGWFLARKAAWSLSGCMATDSADYYMLVNEWVWSKSRDCLLRPEVDMGAVLESELGQKWR